MRPARRRKRRTKKYGDQSSTREWRRTAGLGEVDAQASGAECGTEHAGKSGWTVERIHPFSERCPRRAAQGGNALAQGSGGDYDGGSRGGLHFRLVLLCGG